MRDLNPRAESAWMLRHETLWARVHEAGHAVASFMTSADFGIAPARAVDYIETQSEYCVTVCPRFSREIAQAAKRVDARLSTDGSTAMSANLKAPLSERPSEYYALVMTEARRSGADIAKWLEAKIIQSVAGPLAQSIYQRRNFARMIESIECISDVADVSEAWDMAARVLPLASGEWRQRMFATSKVLRRQLSEPGTWAGLLAVARALPLIGKMDGREAWKIFSQAQQGD